MNRLFRPTFNTSKKILFRHGSGGVVGVTPPFGRLAPPTSSVSYIKA